MIKKEIYIEYQEEKIKKLKLQLIELELNLAAAVKMLRKFTLGQVKPSPTEVEKFLDRISSAR